MIAAEPAGTLASALLRASWQGGVAVVGVWLVCGSLPSLPAARRCWLWRAAVARLLLSLAVTATVALPLLPVGPDPTKASGPPSALREREGETITHNVAAIAASAIARTATAESRARGGSRSVLIELLVSVWAAGVIVSVAQIVLAMFAVKGLRGAAVEVSSEWLRQTCHQLSARLGMKRVPNLLQSSAIDTPALIGCLRTSVVLPSTALYGPTEDAGAKAETLRMMLAHEFAHVKRRDLWWNWLPLAAQTLLWFHPLAWLASRELRLAQESACDTLAMSATGAPPHRYGAMLLDVIEAVGAARRPPPTFSAAVVESRWSVERRLTAMSCLNPRPLPRLVRIAAVTALPLALAVALVPWRLVAQTPAADDEGAKNASRAESVAPGGMPRGATQGTATPADRRVARSLSFQGVVTAPAVSLGVPSGGVVAEVPVNEGDTVKAGQLVARLDDSAAKAALAEAEANYRFKQIQLKRLGELRRNNSVTEAEVEAAEAEAQATQARLVAVHHALEKTRVVAPCDGVVSEVAARPGELARDGSVLVKVVDMSKLALTFNLPDQYLPRVKAGQAVSVTVASVADASFNATIASVAPVVRSGSGTVGVRARFDDTKGRVRPGMAGEVTIPTAEEPRTTP
jgi:RND family efflux transporter MFP subunit